MPPIAKLIGLAAALALGILTWFWLHPRTASDCAPSDNACLRKDAEHLYSESLETTSNPFISDAIQAAGRLLATEGAIDLSAQRDRLTTIGFGPRNIQGVFDASFRALLDPAYPFDIPAAIRLTLADPANGAKTLALWDQLADVGNPSGFASFFILS